MFQPTNPEFITRDQLAFQEGKTFSLEVDIIASDGADIRLRGLTKEGPFEYRIASGSTMTLQTFSFRIPDIPIFFTLIGANTGATTNGTFAAVHLGINGSRYQLLAIGYPNTVFGIAWPNNGDTPTINKRGDFVEIDGADPAAGAESVITVPTRNFWIVKSLQLTLVTSATAATRSVTVHMGNGSNLGAHILPVSTQAASLTIGYRYWPGAVNLDDTTALIKQQPLPHDFVLRPGEEIRTATTNIQTGDNYGVPTVRVERFLMPA